MALKLGDVIKTIRSESGFATQKELSEAMGSKKWSRGKIANYESNLNDPPEEFFEVFNQVTEVDLKSIIQKQRQTSIHTIIFNLSASENLTADQQSLLKVLKNSLDELLNEVEAANNRSDQLKKRLDLKEEQLVEVLIANDNLRASIGGSIL